MDIISRNCAMYMLRLASSIHAEQGVPRLTSLHSYLIAPLKLKLMSDQWHRVDCPKY